MALIAWYKLDGNALDSSGNGHHGTASGATWAGGKIGQCGKLTGALSTSMPSASWSVATHSVTLSGWFKFIEADVISRLGQLTYTYNTPTGTLLGYNHYGGFALTWEATHNSGTFSNFRVFGTLRHSNGAYATATKAVVYGEWAHYAVVFDRNTNVLKLYVDGELLGSTPISSFGQGNYTDRSFYINYGSIYGGNGPGSHMNCFVDDVRVYDHALSPKEVKELARAKILHYKMDDMQESTRNEYLYPTFDTTSSSGGWSHWGRAGHQGTYGQNTDPQYIYGNQIYSHWVANESSATGDYLVYQSPAFEGGYRSVQAIVCSEDKSEITNSKVYPDWNARSGGTPNNAWTSIEQIPGTHFYHCKCEGIMQDGSNDLVGFFVTKGQKIYFSMAQLEQKPHCTPMVIGERVDTVHDSSGYDNHAELALATTPKWVGRDQSKIGGGAYSFNGSQAFQLKDTLPSPPDQVTVSAWVKTDDASVYQHVFSKSTNVISCAIYQSKMYCKFTIGGVSRNPRGSTVLQSNRWYHLVWLYDGKNIKFYIDGELDFTSPDYAGALKASDDPTLIGAEMSGATGSEPMNRMLGLIDDIRVYATALSDEDILELYQTRGSIDSHGNLYVQGIKEHNTYREDIKNANLVENGDQEYGNNYNFSAFEYRESENCLSLTSGSSTVMTSNFIKVQGNGLDSFDRYRLDCYIKGENIRSRFYFMIICYDKYFREISHRQVGMYANTATTLSQALNPGDTWVYMQDISNWQDDGTTNYAHTKSLALWHPNDEKPLLTPYKYTRRTFNVVEVDKTNNRVRLQNPYSGDVIPAGSPACNTRDGSTYPYIGGSNQWTDLNEWKYMSGLSTSSDNLGGMRFGSSYVRVGYLINREATGGTPTTLIKNIRFYNIDNCQNPTLEYSGLSRGISDNGEYATNVFSEVGPIDGIIGWWPLDGHTQDYSGNNNHGTNNGATITSGIRGSAYSFDGSAGQFIDISGHGLHLSEMYNRGATFSCWIKPNIQQTRIAQNIAGFLYLILNASGKLQIMTRDVKSNANEWVYGVKTIPVGEWSHVVCVLEDGVGGKFYVNGEIDGVKNNDGVGIINRDTASRLGWYSGSSLNGAMTDARIYNRALSPEEIKTLYNVTKPNAIPMQLSNDGTVYLSGELKEV